MHKTNCLYNLPVGFADHGSLAGGGMAGWDCGTGGGAADIPHGSAAGPDDGFGDHGSTTPGLESWPSHVTDEGILLEPPPTAFPDSSSTKSSPFFGD